MDKRLRHIALLRCFDAAARNQSYSKAAQELAITQAAVSQQLRNLERQLDVKLFARKGRTMVLTAQGKTLHSHVSQAFELVSRGFDRIQVEPQNGILTVTSSLSFASIWLVPRLWKFSDAYPDISVKIMVSDKLEDLRHSDVDVAIRQGDSVQDEVYQEELIVDPVFPVCSPKRAEENDLISPDQINCCQLVQIEDPGRFTWQNWFNTAGTPFQSNRLSWIEVISWEMGINTVMAGQGICLAPSLMTKDMMDLGLLIKPFDVHIEPGLRYSFLYDTESPRLSRIKVFHKWLKEELRKAE